MEETDNKKSYKYNGYPLDYNRVINTMTANWRSYAQHMHWTSDQEKLARTELNNLLEAAENGMSSDYAGDLIGGKYKDTEGKEVDVQMSNPSWKNKKGENVDANAKKDLSARKQSKLTPNFDPTAEAVQYWQTIVQFVADKTREESKQKEADKKAEEEKANAPVPFTMADNGFWPTFIDTVSPNGIADFDLDWWWGLDPYNKATGTRAVTGRTAELSNVLNDYIKKLESTNYDFSKEKVTKDEYLANLKELQAALADNSFGLEDRGLLQRVGGTPADYKKLFMTDETWTETPSEEEEEEDEYDPEIVADVRAARDNYYANKDSLNKGGAKSADRVYKSVKGDTAEEQLRNWVLAIGQEYGSDFATQFLSPYSFADPTVSGSGLEKFMGQYIDLLKKVDPDFVHKVSYGQYRGYEYLTNSYDEDSMTVLGYSPSTGHTVRMFFPELGSTELATALKRKNVIKDVKTEMEKLFGTSETPKKQEGGTIDFDAARDAMQSLSDSLNDKIAKSKADPKQSRPWAASDIMNDNEFNKAELVRMATLATDIAAIVDPESWSSLALGVAGDIGNYLADRADGYTVGQSLGHLAVGLAGSAMGMIPIVGGALGKTGRVVKGLAKIAPKLINWVSGIAGVGGLLANGSEIVKSLGKLTSNDPNDKMTIGDWRNILVGIRAVLTAKRGFRANSVANARLNQAKTGETMVSVRMKGKPDETGLIGISGIDGERLMVAAKNEDIGAINRILKGYNNGQWELNTQPGSRLKPKEHFWQIKRVEEPADVWRPGSVYENLDPNLAVNKRGKIPPYMREHNFFASEKNKIIKDEPTITAKKTPIKTPKAKPAAEAEAKPAKASITKQNELISQAKEAYGKLPEGMTAAKAKTLDVKDHPHSDAFKELAKTWDETSLIENGYWKRGGKISRARKVAKASGGESLSFSSGSLGSRTSENTGKGLGRKIVKADGGTKIYGLGTTDYVPYLSYKTQYADGQATEEAVAATLAHNNALRQDENINSFTTKHHLGEDEGYKTWEEAAASINSDYYKGEQGMSNLLGDILWAAQNYLKSDPTASREKVLEYALNAPVKFMYDYRYNHPEGTDWYETNDKVAEFNKNHYNRYHGLNTEDWLGYSSGLENTYGSTASIRPVYIAEKAMPLDFSKIDWSKYGEQGKRLKEIFDTDEGQYTQETSGIVSFTKAAAPAAGSNPENTENSGDADIIDFSNYFNGNPNTSLTGNDIVGKPYRGDFSMLGPDMLSLTRYLGSIPTNWQMYKNAKKMPITLYNPMEAHRWVYGDQNAIQQGYRAAGIANHMAANPLTSDGALQTAAQFSAFDQGQDYIRNGYTTNDNMVRQTREANWTQDRTNQQSRYDVHNKNLDNLALHRTSVLTADATRRNTNYNSWSNFLSGLEQNWRSTAEKRQQQASAYAKLSKQNELLKMHIDSLKNDEDRQAINEVVMGVAEYSELSDTQKKLYLEIMHRVQEGLTKWEAGNIGVGYQPYLPGPYAGTSGTTPTWAPQLGGSSLPYNYGRIYKRGGVIGGDSEKVAIQKLRTRVQKMQIFQKHLDSRMTACEKALDRAQRSASQYWRGMTKGK